MTSAYPLQWPAQRPRTKYRKQAQFGTSRQRPGQSWASKEKLTVADAMRRLQDELDRMGAANYVLSTNLATRLDGGPRSGQAEPADPGAALYFHLGKKSHCLPCDSYDRVADNIAAIAKHIEATRAIERYGVATLNEMFAGFTALPAPPSWRETLGVGPTEPMTKAYVQERYRIRSKAAHPDAPGGSHDEMAALNAARDAALRELSA